MKAFVKVFLLVFLSACSGLKTHKNIKETAAPQILNVVFDPSLDQKTQKLIKEVASDLNKRVGKKVLVFNRPKTKSVIFSFSSDFDSWQQLGKTYCTKENCRVLLNKNYRKINSVESYFYWTAKGVEHSALKNTIRHELGHSFGLGHNAENGHIMSEYNSADEYSEKEVSIWAKDLKQFIEKGKGPRISWD